MKTKRILITVFNLLIICASAHSLLAQENAHEELAEHAAGLRAAWDYKEQETKECKITYYRFILGPKSIQKLTETEVYVLLSRFRDSNDIDIEEFVSLFSTEEWKTRFFQLKLTTFITDGISIKDSNKDGQQATRPDGDAKSFGDHQVDIYQPRTSPYHITKLEDLMILTSRLNPSDFCNKVLFDVEKTSPDRFRIQTAQNNGQSNANNKFKFELEIDHKKNLITRKTFGRDEKLKHHEVIGAQTIDNGLSFPRLKLYFETSHNQLKRMHIYFIESINTNEKTTSSDFYVKVPKDSKVIDYTRSGTEPQVARNITEKTEQSAREYLDNKRESIPPSTQNSMESTTWYTVITLNVIIFIILIILLMRKGK